MLCYTVIKEIIPSSMDVIVVTVNGKRGLYVLVGRYFDSRFFSFWKLSGIDFINYF